MPIIIYLELGRHVSISRGDSEEEAVVFLEGIRGGDGIVRLRRSVHKSKDVFWESLGDSE